jgi:hypothetical protein
MHPALPNINKIFDKYYDIIGNCPVSSIILPRESLITTHRKLPPLSSIISNNPFSTPSPPSLPKGFHRSPGCTCKVCKEANFCSFISSSTLLSGRGFSIPQPISCTAVNVVYVVSCPCGLQYVGRTSKPKPRWANHKSHIRGGNLTCNLATHCIRVHRDMVGHNKLTTTDNIKACLSFTILESVGIGGTVGELEEVEEVWRNRLQSWAPGGLNTREDGPARLRTKTNI